MPSCLELIEQIQKNVGVPWQSQRPDGYSDGILIGDPETAVTGIATTCTPSLDVLRLAAAKGMNVIVCREAPTYSQGERSPAYWREGPAPAKEALDKDPVWQAKQEFIASHNLTLLRFFDNWDARETDGQLKGLAEALNWDRYHSPLRRAKTPYVPEDCYFNLPAMSLTNLAASIKKSLRLRAVRVIGNPAAPVRKVALAHGLVLIPQIEKILREPDVDVIVAGDTVEWEGAPYMQDLVTAKMAKGMILIGNEASEEPGSGEVASWLKTFIHGIPIEWTPAGEPFWTLDGGARS